MSARFGSEIPGPSLAGEVAPTTLFVQPIGAVEHHGPHLPLGTDTIVIDEMARAVVASCDGLDMVMLPTLSYGLSTEHVWAPGTVSLSPTTLLAVLAEVAASVHRARGRRLVLLNGHGGNTHLLRVAIRELRAEHGLSTFLLHGSLPPDNGGPPTDPREEGLGIHGGISETSVVLHLRPELVDMDKAVRAVPSWVSRYEYLGFAKAAEFGWLSSDLSDSGVAGDPTLATAELGKEHFNASVEALSKVFEEVATFAFPHEAGKPS